MAFRKQKEIIKLKEKRIKVVYIISNIDKALAFEWLAKNIDIHKYELSFILLNPGSSKLEDFLMQQQISCTRILYRGKKDLGKAFFQLFRIFIKSKFDVVHTHLFDASLIGLLAAKMARIPKRVYTRHHSSLHHVYYPRAVYYDKIINSLANHIVAISGKVKEILIQKEGVSEAKVAFIPHGMELSAFQNVDDDRVAALSKKYNPDKLFPVVGAISRFTHWKGLQFTIPAFKLLLQDYPDALLILANASGDYAPELERLLAGIPTRNFRKIVFENDPMALYQLFDVFVHVPIDDHSEAFGQTYVEALAAGIPAVFTLSGIAPEFIRSRQNAWVVPFQDADAIYEGMKALIEQPELANKMKEQGVRDVFSKFELRLMIAALEKLYA